MQNIIELSVVEQALVVGGADQFEGKFEDDYGPDHSKIWPMDKGPITDPKNYKLVSEPWISDDTVMIIGMGVVAVITMLAGSLFCTMLCTDCNPV